MRGGVTRGRRGLELRGAGRARARAQRERTTTRDTSLNVWAPPWISVLSKRNKYVRQNEKMLPTLSRKYTQYARVENTKTQTAQMQCRRVKPVVASGVWSAVPSCGGLPCVGPGLARLSPGAWRLPAHCMHQATHSLLRPRRAPMACLRRGGRGHEARLNVAPVDDRPDLLEVLGANVLVLKVVRVLPHVDAEQRHEAVLA